MYDQFIEKDELTTQELLGCGFTNKDLTRLIADGKLSRIKRGVYTLPNSSGLLIYSDVLKRRHKFDKSKEVLERCLHFEPSNGSAASRVFANALWDYDFDKAFACMDILMKSEKESYLRDSHLWLYLLQFVADVPERYKEKVKNMTFDDLSVLDDDPRYSDKDLANEVRTYILRKDFNSAIKLISSSKEHNEKRVYVEYTLKLLNMANNAYKRRQRLYEELVIEENYSQLVRELAIAEERYGLSSMERNLYLLASDMVSMRTSKRIPKSLQCSSLSLADAIESHQYKLALELNNFNSRQNLEQNENYAVSMMLTKINDEVLKLHSMKAARKIGAQNFARITNSLMKQDLDGAFESLNYYLALMGKLEYRGYIVSLIKLSLLDKDSLFVEPMLALSRLNNEDYQFDVSIYIQDFYLTLAKGDLKRASIYLDIISNSEAVGGISIDTNDMRISLNNEMTKQGISEVPVDTVEKSGDVKVNSHNGKGESEYKEADLIARGMSEEDAVIRKTDDEYLYLSTIVDDIINGDNVVLLEPMCDEDVSNIMEIIERVKDVKAFTIDTDDDMKQIVLRYCGRIGNFIPLRPTLGRATNEYNRYNFDTAIDLYDSVLPLLPEPKAFIYANLGMSYYKRAKDASDYYDAIDYLTLATVQAKKEGNNSYDYSLLVKELKERTKYNGIKVKSDSGENLNSNGIQYRKVDNKVQE